MPRYLYRASFAAEGVAAMVNNPQNRREVIAPLVEAAGGTLVDYYFAFGTDDALVIVEAPDNVTAAALAMAVAASGSTSITTTVLMTPEEAQEAMNKARQIDYRPPA